MHGSHNSDSPPVLSKDRPFRDCLSGHQDDLFLLRDRQGDPSYSLFPSFPCGEMRERTAEAALQAGDDRVNSNRAKTPAHTFFLFSTCNVPAMGSVKVEMLVVESPPKKWKI